MTNEEQKSGYIAEATLDVNYPYYVERDADKILLRHLQKGDLCYVFNSRKMGKSSLDVRVRDSLKHHNFVCALIDLNQIGINNTVENWYYSLLINLAKEFSLDIADDDSFALWWEKRNRKTYQDKFKDFLELLLKKISQNILIVFDETDVFLGIKNRQYQSEIFTYEDKNDFFAFLRWCYNHRKNCSDYNRLIFCLLGVVTSSDLISDPDRTPFNIGQDIELTGFELTQKTKDTLIKGLGNVDHPEKILEDIWYWTDGQPFLTQKLCKLVVDTGHRNPDIKELVQIKIIDNWEENDKPKYLQRIREEFLREDETLAKRLVLYRTILQNEEEIKVDRSPEQAKLSLSGLVIKKGEKLKICNEICRRIFNFAWIEEQIKDLRPYQKEDAIEWADTKNSSLLLSGKALQDALVWRRRMGGRLDDMDADFLDASQLILKNQTQEAIFTMKERLLGKTSNAQAIATEILQWTNQNLNLTKIICNNISSENVISEGNEKQWLQWWIETYILTSNLENSLVASDLLNIKETLLVSDIKSSFERLNIYKQILYTQTIETIDENHFNALLSSGLIVKVQNQELQVANQIYETVFNQQWIEENLPPYAKSFIAWSNAQDQSFLLKREDLDTALNWLKGKERLNELEIKFIIASLVWKMWQSATTLNLHNARITALEIITKFQTQLKQKNNKFYNFIQQSLKTTAVQPDLLNALLSSFSESEKDIFIEYEAEIEKRVQLLIQERTEQLLINTWTIAYEKAMVEKFNKLAKKFIDQVFCEAVEDLTKRLVNAGYITLEDAADKSQETIEDSIRHHIENLTKGGMFNLAQELTINELINFGENIVEITVEDCTYQEGCKWALDEPLFRENGQYRCQKLGCYVGAVKKYMAEDKLSEDKRNKLDYLMTTVMETTEEAEIQCLCKGFIFVNEGFKRQIILRNYPTQLPTKP